MAHRLKDVLLGRSKRNTTDSDIGYSDQGTIGPLVGRQDGSNLLKQTSQHTRADTTQDLQSPVSSHEHTAERRETKHRSGSDSNSVNYPASSTIPKGSITRIDGPVQSDGSIDWKAAQEKRLDGVVDLRNTVETHSHVKWAPAVTHEVVKRQEHEVVQEKIYREIHYYTYKHYIQPIVQTEMLPARHFMPDPKGGGLIEIEAAQIPSPVGRNKWMNMAPDFMIPPRIEEATHKWRTKAEVIEKEPYMTEEGFERRETTIIYPPTLEDLSGYTGEVQLIHFDHSSGKRWLGNITTMDKLQDQIHHMRVAEDTSNLTLDSALERKPVGVLSMKNSNARGRTDADPIEDSTLRHP